jgi:hypothetical protein
MISLKMTGKLDQLDRVTEAAARCQERMLQQIGDEIARLAAGSMQQGYKGVTSQPGDPPLYWTGRYRDSIEAVYDPDTGREVIGAPITHWAGSAAVPQIIEEGGVELVTHRNGRQFISQYLQRPAMRLALQAAIDAGAVDKALEHYIRTS